MGLISSPLNEMRWREGVFCVRGVWEWEKQLRVDRERRGSGSDFIWKRIQTRSSRLFVKSFVFLLQENKKKRPMVASIKSHSWSSKFIRTRFPFRPLYVYTYAFFLHSIYQFILERGAKTTLTKLSNFSRFSGFFLLYMILLFVPPQTGYKFENMGTYMYTFVWWNLIAFFAPSL